MRKIPPWFVRDGYLRQLIYGAGSLRQAKNELRWLKQEINDPLELQRAIRLRGKSYPLQYILKSQPFGSLDIICEPGALIPRWETEEWTMQLVEEVQKSWVDHQKSSTTTATTTSSASPLGYTHAPPKVLDICTGSGCILFLLCEMLKTTGYGVELSPEALKVFYKNQVALHMQGRTSAHELSLFNPLPPQLRDCELVVSNPPYILEKKEVERSVAQFEPDMALYEVPNLWQALVDRTLETTATKAVFEVGEREQIDEIVGLFELKGWKAEGRKDSAGKWRTVWASR